MFCIESQLGLLRTTRRHTSASIRLPPISHWPKLGDKNLSNSLIAGAVSVVAAWTVKVETGIPLTKPMSATTMQGEIGVLHRLHSFIQ